MIQNLYEAINNELRNLKSDKDEDQVINSNLLKMIHCLSYDGHNNKIDMDFLQKVEVIKQNTQVVKIREYVDFFESVKQKYRR